MFAAMKRRTPLVPATFATTIIALGGPAALARELGLHFQTVRQWRRRDSIPSQYWTVVIATARKHKILGVTLDRFAIYEARNTLARAERGVRVNNGGNRREPHPLDQT